MENKIVKVPKTNFLEKWKIISTELKKVKSIPDVFKNKTPVLSVMKKEYGEEFTLLYLSNWIGLINDFCDGKMSDEQCEVSAESIYEDFYFLTIADLKLISKRLRKRKFIRVSGNEIYNEIEQYFNERCKHAQSFSKEESDRKKSFYEVDIMDDETVKKLYKDVASGKETSESAESRKRKTERDKHKEASERYIKSKKKQ